MIGEVKNLWMEDTDENIVRSWLAGASDGATWPICDHFLKRIQTDKLNGRFDCIEGEWDEIIGPCYRYKLDDPNMEKRVAEIVKGLNDFINRINENPDKYFPAEEEDEPTRYPSFKKLKVECKVQWEHDEGEDTPDSHFEVSFSPEELENAGILDRSNIEETAWELYEGRLEKFMSEYLTDYTDFLHKGFTMTAKPIS